MHTHTHTHIYIHNITSSFHIHKFPPQLGSWDHQVPTAKWQSFTVAGLEPRIPRTMFTRSEKVMFCEVFAWARLGDPGKNENLIFPCRLQCWRLLFWGFLGYNSCNTSWDLPNRTCPESTRWSSDHFSLLTSGYGGHMRFRISQSSQVTPQIPQAIIYVHKKK